MLRNQDGAAITEDLAIGRADIALMTAWAAAEGWNPGRADAGCFHAADPQGFWLARRGGEAAACLSLVTYDAAFALLGFYIARPEFRGRGIGHALWQAALAACPAATVGLDGVVAQQDNYRKSGFVHAHRNVRYAGAVAIDAADRSGLVPIDAALADAVAAYDRGCFPASRRAFLDAWLGAPGHVALAATDGAPRRLRRRPAVPHGPQDRPAVRRRRGDRRAAVPRARRRSRRRAS